VTYTAPDGTQYVETQPSFQTSEGAFSGGDRLPVDAALGTYVVVATDGAGRSASTSFTVS
jgi:hypothetical protein